MCSISFYYSSQALVNIQNERMRRSFFSMNNTYKGPLQKRWWWTKIQNKIRSTRKSTVKSTTPYGKSARIPHFKIRHNLVLTLSEYKASRNNWFAQSRFDHCILLARIHSSDFIIPEKILQINGYLIFTNCITNGNALVLLTFAVDRTNYDRYNVSHGSSIRKWLW